MSSGSKVSHLSDGLSGLVIVGALVLESPLISATLEIDPLLEGPLLSTVLTFFTNLVKPCGLSSGLFEPFCADGLISGCSSVDVQCDERSR